MHQINENSRLFYWIYSRTVTSQNYCNYNVFNRHSGSVVERPLCDREVVGLILGRVIPKTLKMVVAALSLGAQHLESRARTSQLSVSIMLLGGISCQSVWGMIFQQYSKSEH